MKYAVRTWKDGQRPHEYKHYEVIGTTPEQWFLNALQEHFTVYKSVEDYIEGELKWKLEEEVISKDHYEKEVAYARKQYSGYEYVCVDTDANVEVFNTSTRFSHDTNNWEVYEVLPKAEAILEDFFQARPAINKTQFAKECGISRQYLEYLSNGEREASDEVLKKVIETMNLYGYNP